MYCGGIMKIKINKRGRLADGSPNPVDVAVGKKICARRCELGWSMEKLANAIGITFQQIQKYEKGMNRVSASRLYDFSKVLGMPINYFFSGIDETADKYSPRQVSADEMFNEIDDPMNWEESKILVEAYYKIKDRDLANHLLDLMMSIARTNDKDDDIL